MHRKKIILAALLSLSILPLAAQPFSLNVTREAVIGGTLLTGEIFHNIYERTASKEKWDGRVYDKDDVNAFDRTFMHPYNKPLHTAGNVMMALIPAGVFAVNAIAIYKEHDLSALLTETVMAAETFLMAHTVPHTLKPLVSRVRPYNYYDAADNPEKSDWNHSFFSGHTSMAFAAATFGSYTFCKWFPESKMKVPFIAISYSLATLTGISRVYAGCHFATDVLMGAAVGTAIGFFVPWLHRVSTKETQIALVPCGVMVKKIL
ncbi:MAG: phosphatase PAP2 family protein [Treponema sp.]|nr:phosphatase PAP2 family protein [Treponema sp.]